MRRQGKGVIGGEVGEGLGYECVCVCVCAHTCMCGCALQSGEIYVHKRVRISALLLRVKTQHLMS